MKFFHLSDLHLGKRVNGFPMIEDQKYILDRVIELIDREHPDAVIVAGDVYDKSIPPVEAVNLFDDFLVSLAARNVQVFIVSGNHDSAERVSYGGRVMEHSGIHISRRITGARRDEEPEEADDLYADSVEGEPLGSADPYTDDAEGETSEAADLHEDSEAPAVSDLHAEGGDRKSVESAVSGTGGVIVPVRLEDAYGPVYVYLFPYIHPSVVRDAWPDDRIVTWTDAMETLIRHAGVDPDGRLTPFAYGLDGTQYTKHPVYDYNFGDITVPYADRIIEYVKKGHPMVSRFKIISWDIGIDEAGDPVLMEVNLTMSGIFYNQLVDGPLFGGKTTTKEILKKVFKK